MRVVKYSALTLLLLLVAGIGVVLFAPTVLVRPVLSSYLTAAGFQLDEFSELALGGERTSIARLVFQNDTILVIATTTELAYTLPGLVAGNLQSLDIDHLEVQLLQGAPASDEDAPLQEQIAATLRTINALPLANLRINAITVLSENASLDATLQIDTQPLRVTGTVASSQYQDMRLQINAGTDDNGSIDSTLDLLLDTEAIMQATVTVAPQADNLQLHGDAVLNLAALQSHGEIQSRLGPNVLPDETVSFTLQATLADLMSAPGITALDLELDNPDHRLNVLHQADGMQAKLALHLPVRVTGSMASLDQGISLELAMPAADLKLSSLEAGDAVTEDYEFSFPNPSIATDMSYAGETLQATVNLSLANQLHTSVTLAYDTTSRTGDLAWELPPYSFSKITPLSGLITQSLLAADVVAGSITGNGALRISTDTEGNWQLDGPLVVRLDELSGFVGESFFVGLNAELNALVSGAGDIQSREMLSASMATLDVGLPLTDIHWNYSFDSKASRMVVSDLGVRTLGGEITVDDFDYDFRDPDTELTVVLTNLDLRAIVELAQYPELEVRGLISGYLPLTLKGRTITVEEGLVGALKPGGTIRYTSDNPVSSGNSTLDLVNEALANYHYQIMETRVYYNEAGDLRLEVELQGNNPDMYDGQLVNLNVNIDDNIPTLLRSLQASRTITDALEQRLENRRQTTSQ